MELLNLTWEDIDLSNSELLIRQTKNGHQRLLHLSITHIPLDAETRVESG